MFTTGNCYHITIFLLCYLSKIINFNCNEFIFNLLVLISIFSGFTI